MKTYQPLYSKTIAIVITSFLCASGVLLNAQEKKPVAAPVAKPAKKKVVPNKKKVVPNKKVTFSDLEKKLHFDKTPIASIDGRIVSYAPVLEKAMPAVVTVFSSKTIERKGKRNPQQEEMFRRMFPDIPEDFFEQHGGLDGGKQQGLGSGVVIDESGYIITNNHVVGGADEIMVTLSGSRKRYTAKVIGADPQTDIALIKIEASGLKTMTIGDSSNVRVGDISFAIGNPMGLEQTATHGIVSALGRDSLNITGGGFENFIQTDASVNKGNSGGALIDANGRLIGINTAIQSNFGGNIGIAFAIPSNMAMLTVRRLLDGSGTVHRGFIGVYMKELTPEMAKALGRGDQSGVLITEVGSKTPAEKYGMKAGDLIVGFNGNKADSMLKLRLDISNIDPGTKVNFDVIRKGSKENVEVVLGDREDITKLATNGGNAPKPAAPKPKELIKGVQIAELDDKIREGLKLPDDVNGVLVKSVGDKTSASGAGLRSGLVITMIDQRDVSSVKQAYDLVSKVKGDVILLQVYSNGRRDILAVEK